YPNPGNGSFSLHINSSSPVHLSLSIYDCSGRVVFEDDIVSSPAGTDKKYELEWLSPGMYILGITSDGDRLNRKLLIE
ncbi:MAG: T9SS type A sorting domain-containing protein, partial [Flavobacteriales bacterium]